MPDPRVTNPELFDLTRPDAPIPQFVNAIRNAGIEVSPETVLNNLTFEYRQYPVRDENGNLVDGQTREYVFGVWNLPRELLPERYQDLAGPIPIVMGRDENREWKWENYRVVPFRVFADSGNILIGSNNEGLDHSMRGIMASHFNLLMPATTFRWSENQPLLKSKNTLNYTRYIDYAYRNDIEIISPDILCCYPQWLTEGNFANRELEQIIARRIREIFEIPITQEIQYWIIKNEYHPHEDDYLNSRLGFNYLIVAYAEARRIRPDAILIYADNASETARWPYFRRTYDTIKQLKDAGLVDAVGLQGHINQPNWTDILGSEEFANAIRAFRNLGVEVYLTEMDFGIQNIRTSDRFLVQAYHYKEIISTYLEETNDQSVRIINFWGLRDNESWYDYHLQIPNGDPLLFDDYGNPKMSYFAILSLLYEKANEGLKLNP